MNTSKLWEAVQGLSLGSTYLFIKTSINPALWSELIHSCFAIGTAIIIAVLSTIVVHYVKKFLK